MAFPACVFPNEYNNLLLMFLCVLLSFPMLVAAKNVCNFANNSLVFYESVDVKPPNTKRA